MTDSLKEIVKRVTRRIPRAPQPIDHHAKEELDLFIENTSELYGQKQNILANIRRRILKGTYNPALASKLWMYWVDAGARRYCKENHMGGNIGDTFNKPTRMALAEELAKRYATGQE